MQLVSKKVIIEEENGLQLVITAARTAYDMNHLSFVTCFETFLVYFIFLEDESSLQIFLRLIDCKLLRKKISTVLSHLAPVSRAFSNV